jgi:hypothetical protein
MQVSDFTQTASVIRRGLFVTPCRGLLKTPAAHRKKKQKNCYLFASLIDLKTENAASERRAENERALKRKNP